MILRSLTDLPTGTKIEGTFGSSEFSITPPNIKLMKLQLVFGRWTLGNEALHCGQQVRIKGVDFTGRTFWFNGRFEIAGQNNPVFFTVFGRISPDLETTEFALI